MFVSIKGRPYTWFIKALEVGDLTQVRANAADLQWISLPDALRILELIAAQEPATYDRAAARWLGRLLLEQRHAELEVGRQALAALDELPERPEVAEALRRLVQR